MTTFQKVSVVASKLNRMPVNYRSFAGTEFQTYYTTWEFLTKIKLGIGQDNSVDIEFRSLEDSCLKELGFKYIATFINKVGNGAIAILGI